MADESRTRDDIWQRIDAQSSQIGEIRSGQAATDARLGALESAVDAGFRTLSTELSGIAERVNRPAPPPNYLGIVVVALGLLGMFGSFTFLITGPHGTAIEKNYDRIAEVERQRERTAALEARVEFLTDEARTARQYDLESAYIHGQADERGKRVEDIDTYGSRRWRSERDQK